MATSIPETLDLDRIATLVDHRTEEPDVEYKSWMDLSSPEYKSKIAKHLCALANYGGGWLVFGIEDDGSPSEPHPGNLDGYGQDIINGIVGRYLHPSFHCRVHFVTSKATQRKYPIVQVPPHGAQPICAKSDGPLVDKRRVGVTNGVHYIRIPGPSSVPVDRPDLWQQLIHRCVTSERDSLLTSISRLFASPTTATDTASLDNLLDALIDRWTGLQRDGWLTDPKENRTALGFQLMRENKGRVSPIKLSTLKSAIREASNAVDAESPGHTTFDLSHSGANSPKVIVDGQVEGYEVVAIDENGSYSFAPAFWNVLADGVGVEIRTYHEDSDWVKGAVQQRSSRAWVPGHHLSPKFQAIRVYESVSFVRHLSRAFPDAVSVRFAADYQGLADRTLRNTRAGSGFEHKSSSSGRRFAIETTIDRLAGDGATEVVALLLNPILRLFDGSEISSDFVRRAVREAS